MLATPGEHSRELVYAGTMRNFLKLCLLPAILEVMMIYLALYAAQTVPVGGDPTYRYMRIGVPGFWAVTLPLVALGMYVFYKGQYISITPKAFVFRRGNYTSVILWHEAFFRPPESSRFDSQMSIASRSSVIVIRSLFFPPPVFKDIQTTIERILAARDSAELVI